MRCAGSEYAAASIGISATRARIIAFSLSAGIAGFGGGLLATYYGQANYDQSFQFFLGLVWVVLVVTAGARSVQAAVVSGLGFFLIPEFLSRLFEIPQRYANNHPDLPNFVDRRAERHQARVGAGSGLHPVRVRRAHLRQASRGHHRTPDQRIHPAHDPTTESPSRAR